MTHKGWRVIKPQHNQKSQYLVIFLLPQQNDVMGTINSDASETCILP